MSPSLSTVLRRRAQSFLAGKPPLYLRVLRWAGRGSLEKRVYLSLIRRDDVVLDVGANHGQFTLLFSDLVGERGEVHAFEPLPPTFARLRQAVERDQQFDNIRLNNVACAEHACEITLHVPGEDSGQASLKRQQAGSWKSAAQIHQLPVQAIRLDEYDRGALNQRLDFVKCDIEGAELLALRGLMSRLARFHPLLFLEVFSAWTEPFGYGPAELVAFLEAVGYDTFYLVTDRLTPMCEAYAALPVAAARESVNLLCARSTQHTERLKALAGM